MQIVCHGIDIVDVARIARMLNEHGERFIERCFTPGEHAYCTENGTRRPERYAARFACKEAVLKAIGTGWRDGISWCDIEVRREPSGQPRVVLTNRCAEIASNLGVQSWLVSVSHTENLAIASVIGCG